jgi:hypothetical protein
MTNAKELMLEYTAFSFREPKKAAEMFAEDGAFELPYLATFGLPTEYRGRDAIADFFQSVLDIYPSFQFENTKVLIDTPDQAFAEFEATAVSSKTGRTIHQPFFSRLVAENGKIKLFREALNTFEVAGPTYKIARVCFEQNSCVVTGAFIPTGKLIGDR